MRHIMDKGEGNLDLLEFGAGVGTPLMKPTGYGSVEGNIPMEAQGHYVPADRLKKFEEFIEEPVEGAPEPPKYWSLQFFLPYFDVTTALIVHRLLRAVKAHNSEDFFEGLMPDLYAPYWILTTLVCVLTISGNTANYITLGSESFSANLSLLVSCSSLVYLLALAVPFAAYCLFKHADSQVKFLSLLSLYCYSYLVFIPAVLVAALDIGWAQWVILLIASCWSFLLLYKNYHEEVETRMPAKRYLMLAVVLMGYLVFILAVNMKFLAIESVPESANTANGE